jgi:hypothetical protein
MDAPSGAHSGGDVREAQHRHAWPRHLELGYVTHPVLKQAAHIWLVALRVDALDHDLGGGDLG